MKSSIKAVFKEKLPIIVGAVCVLVIIALAVSLTIFEIRKSPDEEGRYILLQQW